MHIQYKKTKIHFTSTGKGSAIVLLHGFLENISMWNKTVEQLSKKYRVICIDLLGHGESENHGYVHSMEEQAEMVKTVLDYLKLRKYVLVGHSMGGYIALAFSKLYISNVKGLCLMNSTALPDSEEKKTNRNRAIEAVKQNYKMFVRIAVPMLFSEKNRTVFKNEVENVVSEALKMTPQGIIAAIEGMKIRQDNTSILKSDNFPKMMFVGKEDPALDYNTLIEQSRNTSVKVIEYPDGHMSHIENKNDFILDLENFVKSCFR